MAFPKTLIEFQAMFADEEGCWLALRRAGWPRGFRCPRCGGSESSWITTRRLEQCSGCRYQASVTAGTVLHRTRVPLKIWLLGIFFMARHKQGISALQFQRDMGSGWEKKSWRNWQRSFCPSSTKTASLSLKESGGSRASRTG